MQSSAYFTNHYLTSLLAYSAKEKPGKGTNASLSRKKVKWVAIYFLSWTASSVLGKIDAGTKNGDDCK